MGELRSLSNQSAVEKIAHIAKGEVGMLCTFGSQGLHARPMATSGVDPDGALWFMSRRSSEKNREIAANPRVQVMYSIPGRSEYLTLEGTAAITDDRRKIEELWSAFAKVWFNEGKDDPEISLIRVTPTGGHYWDTKTNKMIQLAKIAVGALVGAQTDDGVEGDLDV